MVRIPDATEASGQNSSVTIDIPELDYNERISLEECDFSASVSVTVNDGDITGTIEATFEFEGLTLTVPTFSGNISLSSVEDLVDAIFQQIVNNVDSVFSDMISDILKLGKGFVKFINKVEDDIKSFVDWLLGDHKSHTPDYLKNGALITNGGPVFEVENMMLRWVPDPTTLTALKGTPITGMSPVIAALKQDQVMVPSRMDGTVLQSQDDLQWFLIASAYQSGHSGPSSPAKYVIKNVTSFEARCSGPVEVSWQVNQFGGGSQSTGDEIQPIPDNDLLNGISNGIVYIESDASQGPNFGSISLFIDGVRYHIGQYLWSAIGNPPHITIPDIAYSNMPQYQGLGNQADDYTIDIAQGSLYKSDNPAEPDIYYASTGSDGLNAGLYYISYAQWVSFWQSSSPTLIPDAFWGYIDHSQSNSYPCTNPPPSQMAWVYDLGNGGNDEWPAGQVGNTVEYGVSFVNGSVESKITWGPQLPITGYMCAELRIPTDSSNWATVRNIYRQFFINGTSDGNPKCVGTINDNLTTVWQDTSPAYNIAAPQQLAGPHDGDWQASLPIANSLVWLNGNKIQYALSYVFEEGETGLSQWSDLIVLNGYAYPYFDNVPLCPTGTEPKVIPNSTQLITRNLYRQCTDSYGNVIDSQRLVGQISDNTTTDFRDSVPTPSVLQNVTWVYDLGNGGNDVWPAGQVGNTVEYGVSFVNGSVESTITWEPQQLITGYMCAELSIPTDSSNWATARNIYRQFLDSDGSNYGPLTLVGTISDNTTTSWQDINPAYNIAAPQQLAGPNNGDWQADAPIANSKVWQVGNQVQYALTYVFSNGETGLSQWSAPITVGDYAYPYFDSVPICPTETDGTIPNSTQPISRNFYRQCIGPAGNLVQSKTLVGQIGDNKITDFRDSTP